MSRLLTGYAVYFNLRHRRSGQLFQNRYKSILCQEDAYLTELVRYIHLNPLRAGLIKSMGELDHYPYCGRSVLMGNKKRNWQDTEYVLNYFGKHFSSARRHYHDFVSEGIPLGCRNDLTGGGLIRSLGGWNAITRSDIKGEHIKSDERILGDSEFVDSLFTAANEKYKHFHKIRHLGFDLEKTAKRVSELCDVEVADIFSRGRQKEKVKARSIFCYWACRELEITCTELAKRLNVSLAAVSYAVARGEAIVRDKGYTLLVE
jgi:hypothetical protein